MTSWPMRHGQDRTLLTQSFLSVECSVVSWNLQQYPSKSSKKAEGEITWFEALESWINVEPPAYLHQWNQTSGTNLSQLLPEPLGWNPQAKWSYVLHSITCELFSSMTSHLSLGSSPSPSVLLSCLPCIVFAQAYMYVKVVYLCCGALLMMWHVYIAHSVPPAFWSAQERWSTSARTIFHWSTQSPWQMLPADYWFCWWSNFNTNMHCTWDETASIHKAPACYGPPKTQIPQGDRKLL